MKLSGLHLLLTYECNLECDHCFVWGSPWQSGTMTLARIREILKQAVELGTLEWIYFEGGEPFLYYPILMKAVQQASEMGLQVGIVSNGYWATSKADALEWLSPFAGLIQDLSISSDLYHWDENLSRQAKIASGAAEQLNIPVGLISIAQPEAADTSLAKGQLPIGESAVMYRGRAAQELAGRAAPHAWEEITECPNEDLREPGRIHVDPFGNLHICQGVVIGNLFEQSLAAVCSSYDPEAHAITGPLLVGGPRELVLRYNLPHEEQYADACHLCDHARRELRARFPEILIPDQMYLDPQ
ncbi:MAG: radical SAM protein [Anaerolineae bacterium]|nr:MAG: radical SAM protein [Anaerolineae bacterium]